MSYFYFDIYFLYQSLFLFELKTLGGVIENNLVEVLFTKDDLLERTVSPANMNCVCK